MAKKIGWERKGDKVIGHFTAKEIHWLHRHLLRFHRQLRTGHAWIAGDHLVESGVAGAGSPGGRAAEIIIGARCGRDGVAAISRPRQLEFLVQTRSAVDTALATLPDRGGRIELRGRRQVLAWIWALHEYGLTLSGEQTAALARIGAGREEWGRKLFDRVTGWLSWVADDLVGVIELPPDYPDGS